MHAFFRSLLFWRSSSEEDEAMVSCSSGGIDKTDGSDCDQSVPDDRASMFSDDPDPFGRDWQWLREPEKKSSTDIKAADS